MNLFDQHRRSLTCVDPATIPDVEFRDGMWRGPRIPDAVIAIRRGQTP